MNVKFNITEFKSGKTRSGKPSSILFRGVPVRFAYHKDVKEVMANFRNADDSPFFLARHYFTKVGETFKPVPVGEATHFHLVGRFS